MIPEIDTQLTAVIKALSDNILPALDQTNPMAQEQMQLCLATLGLIRGNLPSLHRFLRRDLEGQIELATEIADFAESSHLDISALKAAVADSQVLLTDPEMGATEVEQQVRLLKEAVVEAVNAARGSDVETDIAQAILAAEEAAILRSRAWCLNMGFEPDPTQIPALDELVKK